MLAHNTSIFRFPITIKMIIIYYSIIIFAIIHTYIHTYIHMRVCVYCDADQRKTQGTQKV